MGKRGRPVTVGPSGVVSLRVMGVTKERLDGLPSQRRREIFSLIRDQLDSLSAASQPLDCVNAQT